MIHSRECCVPHFLVFFFFKRWKHHEISSTVCSKQHHLPFIPLYSIQYSQYPEQREPNKKNRKRGEASRAHNIAHEQPGGMQKKGHKNDKTGKSRSHLPATNAQQEANHVGLLLLLNLFHVFEGTHLDEKSISCVQWPGHHHPNDSFPLHVAFESSSSSGFTYLVGVAGRLLSSLSRRKS